MTINNKRGLIARSILIILYITLACVMFVTGRSHTILIDNKGAEDGSYKAINGMTVTVNKCDPSEFMKGDRDKFVIKGQKVKIHVESFNGRVDEKYVLTIPLKQDAVLISIPKLVNQIENPMEPFEL